MRILKASIVALASLFAVSTVQAASFSAPVSKPTVESGFELVAKKAAKKPAKKAKAKSKKKASKAGKCGTFMYSKKGKCLDARNKK